MKPNHFKKLFYKDPVFNFYAAQADVYHGLKWLHAPAMRDDLASHSLLYDGYSILQTSQLKPFSFSGQSLEEFVQTLLRHLPDGKIEVFISSCYEFEVEKNWLSSHVLKTYAAQTIFTSGEMP